MYFSKSSYHTWINFIFSKPDVVSVSVQKFFPGVFYFVVHFTSVVQSRPNLWSVFNFISLYSCRLAFLCFHFAFGSTPNVFWLFFTRFWNVNAANRQNVAKSNWMKIEIIFCLIIHISDLLMFIRRDIWILSMCWRIWLFEYVTMT